MKLSVFGLGYVGAVSCGCLAEIGHQIVGMDVDCDKVDLINAGRSPVIEPQLEERIAAGRKRGKLRATGDPRDAVMNSEAALICVGTPSTRSGGVNAAHLRNVAKQIGQSLRDHPSEHYVVFVRSTSLAPIHVELQAILEESSGRKIGEGLGYVCHPEFLREGVAVLDFYDPPKIVFGATDRRTEELCNELYYGIEAPLFFVTPEVASMVKYADNCFHAVKVTFANEIGSMCRELGIDSHKVMEVFCRDRKLNISAKYLRPGATFGGSCLPKDLRAMLDVARDTAVRLPMLDGVVASNELQKSRLASYVCGSGRVPVGVVGLAFKENTDDLRESPMVALVEQLLGKGHGVLIYDRHLAPAFLTGANLNFALQTIPHLTSLLSQDLQEVVSTSHTVVISHGLSREAWAAIDWTGVSRIIDLVGIDELKGLPGYEGLYW